MSRVVELARRIRTHQPIGRRLIGQAVAEGATGILFTAAGAPACASSGQAESGPPSSSPAIEATRAALRTQLAGLDQKPTARPGTPEPARTAPPKPETKPATDLPIRMRYDASFWKPEPNNTGFRSINLYKSSQTRESNTPEAVVRFEQITTSESTLKDYVNKVVKPARGDTNKLEAYNEITVQAGKYTAEVHTFRVIHPVVKEPTIHKEVFLRDEKGRTWKITSDSLSATGNYKFISEMIPSLTINDAPSQAPQKPDSSKPEVVKPAGKPEITGGLFTKPERIPTAATIRMDQSQTTIEAGDFIWGPYSHGQVIIPSASGRIEHIELMLSKSGQPKEPLVVYIRPMKGTEVDFDASPLAIAEMSPEQIQDRRYWLTIPFPKTLTQTQGQPYAITAEMKGASSFKTIPPQDGVKNSYVWSKSKSAKYGLREKIGGDGYGSMVFRTFLDPLAQNEIDQELEKVGWTSYTSTDPVSAFQVVCPSSLKLQDFGPGISLEQGVFPKVSENNIFGKKGKLFYEEGRLLSFSADPVNRAAEALAHEDNVRMETTQTASVLGGGERYKITVAGREGYLFATSYNSFLYLRATLVQKDQPQPLGWRISYVVPSVSAQVEYQNFLKILGSFTPLAKWG